MTGDATQDEVRRFLSDPATHGAPVEVIETHISVVFLTPDAVYKMKKAIRFAYLDYGTPEKRRGFCEAEVEVNRRTAPGIYLGVLAVTREHGGGLAIGGDGEPVEWIVHMNRFDDDQLMDRVAQRGELSPEICRDTADAIFDFHCAAETRPAVDAPGEMAHSSAVNIQEMRRHGPAIFDPTAVDRLEARSEAAIEAGRTLMNRRAREGCVRHLHGDLHLRNIVLLDGRPTPFDAIEFDPALAEIDELYDLAFLLMDLLHRDLKAEANLIANRYLARGGDYEGVSLLPLFLSLRAAIRAHITASAAAAPDDAAKIAEARAYLDLALSVLEPDQALVVAVGGPSGSGKSTAAALLAPELGGGLGAVHLRSDVVRKRIMGRNPEEKLPEAAYTPEVSARVFETLAREAAAVVRAGRPVVVDAVFGRPANHDPLRQAAAAAGAPFHGIWLDADPDVLRTRVAGRRNDASDADVAVLEQQLGNLASPPGWYRINAAGTPEETVKLIRAALAL